MQFPVSSYCPLIWSYRKAFSLHSGQGGLWLTTFLTSPQHSSFKEDLLKAQGFPELVRQCQTSVLSHHFQRLSLAAELVFEKSVTVSRGTLTQGHLTSLPITMEGMRKFCAGAYPWVRLQSCFKQILYFLHENSFTNNTTGIYMYLRWTSPCSPMLEKAELYFCK